MLIGSAPDNCHVRVYGDCDVDSAEVKRFVKIHDAATSHTEAECVQFADLSLMYRPANCKVVVTQTSHLMTLVKS